MARLIRDDIVMSRLKERGFDNKYLQYLEQYAGPVKTQLDKVKLNPSPMGLMRGASPLKDFNDMYELLKIKEDFGVLAVDSGNGRFAEIKLTIEEIKVLKVLLLKNVSRSEDYSSVVGTVWLSLVQQLMQSKGTIYLTPDESWSTMQKVTFEYCVEFVRSKISKDVVVPEVIESDSK